MSAKRTSRSRARAGGRSPGSRWLLPAGLFLLTIAIVTGLWFTRIRSTSIELEAVSADLGFKTSDEQPINYPLALKSLGLAGATRVEFPPDLAVSGNLGRDPGAGIRLALADPAKGSISLARVTVPGGSRASIHDDGDLAYRMSIDGVSGHEYLIEATIEGDVLIGPANGQATLVSVAAPKLVTATFGDPPAELDFALLSSTDRALANNLQVTTLGLSGVEAVGSDLAAQQSSGISSGELTLHDLGDRSVPLRFGSDLLMILKDGELRSAGLTDEGIKLHFAGTVRGMQGGSGRRPVELMPTALEWLVANQRLALIWSAIAYLFGIVWAVSRWWKGDNS